MAKDKLDFSKTGKTSIVTSQGLIDRVSDHVRKNGETQQEFITRALVNQLEKEGDFEIWQIVEEEIGDGN